MSSSMPLSLGVRRPWGPEEEAEDKRGTELCCISFQASRSPPARHQHQVRSHHTPPSALTCHMGSKSAHSGTARGRGAGGLGERREGEHLSVKMKSPSLRAGTCHSLLLWKNSLLGSCPVEQEVLPLQGKNHSRCALSLPSPARTPRPGWAKRNSWGCGESCAGPRPGLGARNGDGLPALPPPRAAEGFWWHGQVLPMSEREFCGRTRVSRGKGGKEARLSNFHL